MQRPCVLAAPFSLPKLTNSDLGYYCPSEAIRNCGVLQCLCQALFRSRSGKPTGCIWPPQLQPQQLEARASPGPFQLRVQQFTPFRTLCAISGSQSWGWKDTGSSSAQGDASFAHVKPVHHEVLLQTLQELTETCPNP